MTPPRKTLSLPLQDIDRRLGKLASLLQGHIQREVISGHLSPAMGKFLLLRAASHIESLDLLIHQLNAANEDTIDITDLVDMSGQ